MILYQACQVLKARFYALYASRSDRRNTLLALSQCKNSLTSSTGFASLLGGCGSTPSCSMAIALPDLEIRFGFSC